MKPKTLEQWPHIPNEAVHLATDEQIARALRCRDHTVNCNSRLITAHHKDTGAYVAWNLEPHGEAHPMSYRAQIIRALVRLSFFAAFVAAALGIWALAF